MAKINWTAQQQAAINDRGGTLLLSAAAGSGKTAVLVERVVDIISDKHSPVSIDQLLIVTFSNAAAAEMRQRISMRISQLIKGQPDNTYLQRQQSLISGANIRTVHGFCMDLIRENFQHLSIAPDFTIIDEKELDILKQDAVMECIDEFYQGEKGEEFAQLVELLSYGRDDKKLIDTVFKVYTFARSHRFYKDWLDRKLGMYDPSIPAGETIWGRTLLDHTRQTLEYSLRLSRQSRDSYITGDEVLESAYLPAWESDMAQLENILAYIEDGDWDGAVKSVASFKFERLKAVRGDDEAKEKAKQTRDYIKKLVAPIAKNYLSATEEEFSGDIDHLRPKIDLLFELVKVFGDNLTAKKTSRKKLDFSDLEHLALELLIEKDEKGYRRTAEAEAIGRQFKYIMVDEYQDTNEVQDLIFESLSLTGDNLFMVGDVKQSIYSFRLAMPEIFLQKKRRFIPYDGVSYPAAMSLDTNFRSRKEVIDGANYIFSAIMSRQMGEIDYDEAESLKLGAGYPAQPTAAPELLIVDCEDYDGDEDNTYLEAVEVARKIDRMLKDEYQISDKDSLRTATAGDFCIIMRSPRTRAETYIKALSQFGLTGVADNSGNFFDTREISAVISLLRVLDNPLLDIELAGAMLSPMLGFTEDDLARIRLAGQRLPFYMAVKEVADQGDEKCQRLLELITRLRYFVASHSADQLILEIYAETSWLELCRAMPFGEGRHGNLLLLVEYAAYYDTVGYKGLGGFVALLDRIREQGGQLDGATNTSEGGNAVKIISVHRSKGLEYPIVILADTSRRFNKRDLYDSTLLHSEYGFACMRRDSEKMTQFPTIPMSAIRLEMQKTLLSEEMRILYVALTRAKEKLIVTASVKKNLERVVSSQWLELTNGKLPPFMVGEASCYADWIMMALLHHPSCQQLRELGEIDSDSSSLLSDGNSWIISRVKASGGTDTALAEKTIWKSEPDKALLERLEERLNYQYPYMIQTQLPNKLAVSAIAGREREEEFYFTRRPKFLARQKLTPAEKGNALHKFMQFADYNAAKTDLEREIVRMEKSEYLSPTEAQSLSKSAISSFFDSSLAERIFTSDKVYRELRFISEFGKDQLEGIVEGIDEESKVVVQGIADCVFIENGKAVIVDYKTDRIKNLAELLAKYEQQVNFYRLILEQTLQVPVSGCILYSFALSDWIEG